MNERPGVGDSDRRNGEEIRAQESRCRGNRYKGGKKTVFPPKNPRYHQAKEKPKPG